jgi:hypothetical protein
MSMCYFLRGKTKQKTDLKKPLIVEVKNIPKIRYLKVRFQLSVRTSSVRDTIYVYVVYDKNTKFTYSLFVYRLTVSIA